MKNFEKYTRCYFSPPKTEMKWAKKEYIDKAPIWCSVDLRDGNQALIVPMSLEEKLNFFKFLCKIGFKEIEVGFPAASDTEYQFLRALIEKDLIPEDVRIQVLTQSRPHIIEKTFKALEGVKKAVVHLYNSTSVAQREQVFKKSKEEIIEIATFGATELLKYKDKLDSDIIFEYSPESFTGTEPEFSLEICNKVLDIWKPTGDKKVIINLPVTVSHSMPHIYANQVEYMCDNLKYRENVIVSLHPHNDRGCAVADTELGILAGANRVEGTLFGNGERTGNADIVTIALNMFSHGVDPKLNLENLPEIIEAYEEATGMKVYDRQPYSGKLVFAAFSGSHQDAIAKGMKYKEDHPNTKWNVPYLPIDPKDIGRQYDGDVIRINSQSGKGGISFVLEKYFGFDLPKNMREEFGYHIKGISDNLHKELSRDEIYNDFIKEYVNIDSPVKLIRYNFTQEDKITADATFIIEGEEVSLKAEGNGRLDAISNALSKKLHLSFDNLIYEEHALTKGSGSQAVAYVGIEHDDKTSWGVGIDNDIMTASIKALISAVNRF